MRTARIHHPFPQYAKQFGNIYGFRYMIIHTCRKRLVTVTYHGISSHGNNRKALIYRVGSNRSGCFEEAPTLIPWAWSINGCASVISAVAATLIAVEFGFTVLIILSLALYAITALCFPTDSLVDPHQ